MRILVVSNMWPGPRKPYYGVFVALRVAAYRRHGAEVMVAAIDDPRRGALITPTKYASLTMRSLWAAVRGRPDVVEGHYLVPTGIITWLAARLTRRPYVLYAHGSDVAARGGLLGRLVDGAVRGAAEIHTNSEDTAERLRSRHPEATIRVLPVGVDLDAIRPGPPDRANQILFVGNLEPHKGPDLLLEALGWLPDEPAWTATFLGEGSLREELERRVAAAGMAGRVRFEGAVSPDDLPVRYAAARLLVAPSRREAFGQAAVEALVAGTPVVVTDVGGLAGIPGPDCGVVVPPDDPEALATAIVEELSRPLDETRIAAARARAGVFSADALAQEALERLRAIAQRAKQEPDLG